MTQKSENASTEAPATDLVSQMTTNIANSIIELFELVIKERKDFYSQNPNAKPNINQVPNIAGGYANTNAAISGGASLVPGPLGMLTVVPEIAAVTRNQLAMIYEIGLAHGQEKSITKELLAAVLASATGSSLGALMIVHGSKIIIKRASLRVFQQVVILLGGRITQQVLKSSISRWIPFLGAGAMAAWSHYTTHLIAKKAIEVFIKEIVIEDSEEISSNETKANFENSESEKSSVESQKVKLQVLVNLMLSDNEAHESEKDYITDLIDGMVRDQNLSENEKTLLLDLINRKSVTKVDLNYYKNNLDESVGIIVDLIALAKRDGEIRNSEKSYIESVAAEISFSSSDLNDLFNF